MSKAKGKPVGELITEDALVLYGYLLLPIGVMQAAGSAAQTVAGIRSHWGRATYADPRTIAVAACLDESTVRRRHLPKLFRMEWVGHRMIKSQLGHRREYYFAAPMRSAYHDKKSATLPRWAALAIPEWSYRAVYAVILQRSLATSRGSQGGPVELDTLDVIVGGYGRHNFSLSHLQTMTGLGRKAVVDAKVWLVANEWLSVDGNYGRGDELSPNDQKSVPASVLKEAFETTRQSMFGGKRKGA
jgi:hypothetical protein